MKLVYLGLIALILSSCKEKNISPEESSCLSAKSISLNWENKVGKDLKPFISYYDNLVVNTTIDGANMLAKINTSNGSIISSLKKTPLPFDNVFYSNSWLVNGHGQYYCYNFVEEIVFSYLPEFNASNGACVINNKLYMCGRLGISNGSTNQYDYHFASWSLDSNIFTNLTFASISDHKSFIPHFFFVDMRQTNPTSFYFVHGQDLSQPHSLTFSKFNTLTNSFINLFNFESKGIVSDFIVNDNVLSFKSFREDRIINVDLNNDKKISVSEFDEEIIQIFNSEFAYTNTDGFIKFYNALTAELVWERDYSAQNIESNLVVSNNEIYAVGFNEIIILDKNDGCILHRQVLDFIGDQTSLWLDNDIVSLNEGEILAKNNTTIYSIKIE